MTRAARGGATPIRPLTERILARLGRPRLFWMLAWGIFPFVAYEVSFRVFHIPTYPGLAVAISSACINLLSLWAMAKMSADLHAARPLIERLMARGGADAWPFRALENVTGPLVVALIMTFIWNGVDFVRHPDPTTVFLIPVMFVAWLPAETMLWFFGAFLIGLDRLGRLPLQLVPFEEDRSLGLRPLGSIAFMGFVIFTAGVLPLMATQWHDPRGVVTNLVFFLGAVVLFFASLRRLHTQLVAAKVSAVRQAHQLYVEAFRPIRAQWSLDTAAGQSARLTAAEAIERRAAAVQEWPLDESLLARIAAIVTSVVGVILARLILSHLGL